MKRKIKILSVLLATLLCFASATLVYASGAGAKDGGYSPGGEGTGIKGTLGAAVPGPETSGTTESNSGTPGLEMQNTQSEMQNTQSAAVNSENRNGSASGLSAENGTETTEPTGPAGNVTRAMARTCKALKEQLSGLENDCIELQNEYQNALRMQNENEAQQLREKIQTTEQERTVCEEQLKQTRLQLRDAIRASYTEKEIVGIKAAVNEIKIKYPDARVLPVENLIPLGFEMKLDTPPVIREGRTLVPLRALVEGMGAGVKWNGEDGTIIIVKAGMTIKLQLQSRIAYVNGKEVTIDVPPEIINNRTVLPLRFIMQCFNYEVIWDSVNELIEISSPQ